MALGLRPCNSRCALAARAAPRIFFFFHGIEPSTTIMRYHYTTAALDSICKFDCCMVGHHRHTIATVPRIVAMVECCLRSPSRYDVHWLAPSRYHVVIARSLAIRCKNCIIVARSSRYDIKNTIVVIIARVWYRHRFFSFWMVLGSAFPEPKTAIKNESANGNGEGGGEVGVGKWRWMEVSD